MKTRLSFLLLIVMLISSGAVGAYGPWDAPGTTIEYLEDIIVRLESDIQRAREGGAAHPAFLAALESYVDELYGFLFQMGSELADDAWRDFGEFPRQASPDHLDSLADERDIILEDRFGGELSPLWEPLQANGGSFERFARMEPDQLTIDVPAGNDWGVTGIVSRQPVFTIEESMAEQPLEITIFSDPVFSTSVLVYLSPRKTTSNPWHTTPFASILWARPELREASLLVRDGHNLIKRINPNTDTSPHEINLRVSPGQIVYQFPSLDVSWVVEYDWLQPGTPLYLAIHAQGYQAGAAGRLALRSVVISRTSPVLETPWAGEYGIDWDGIEGIMTLTQDNGVVTGQYTYELDRTVNGTLEGKIDGRELHGTWKESVSGAYEASGTFSFHMLEGGNEFTGTWADFYSSGTWGGVRK